MTALLRALRFALLAILLSAFAAGANAAPVAKRDWTRSIAATPEGGYRIGNPAAPVKIIEYFSLTCPHCRHFAQTGLPALRTGYLKGGKVSLELRNFVLNGPDIAASILMRCGSPVQAVALFDAIYADQDALFAGAYALSDEAQERIKAAPLETGAATFAHEAGIDRWFAAHAVPPAKARACFADKKREQALIALRQAAVNSYSIEGTPSFVVNGTKIDGVTWDDLEPAIKAALAK